MTNAVTQRRAGYRFRFTVEEVMSKPILMGVVAAFCMAATSPVMAATPDPAGAPKAEKSEAGATSVAEDTTKYCVVETHTGSHISKKTCRTRKEWLAQGVDQLKQ